MSRLLNEDKFPRLRAYLRALTTAEKNRFAHKCGTTLGYLRKFLSRGGELDASTVSLIVSASGGRVPADELRPDVNWDALALHIGEHALVPEALPARQTSRSRTKVKAKNTSLSARAA